MQARWTFYGRSVERAEIARIVGRRRWFFCAITGRRRIGKTTLIRTVLRSLETRTLYVQIPDSDPFGVVIAMRDAIEDHGFADLFDPADIRSLADVAQAIAALCRAGSIIVLDEFHYFHRKSLSAFTSHLQAEVDKLQGETITGGLFVLGSIHTEMTAILEDRASPLFSRVTDRLELDHWDFATLVEMFDAQGISDPNAWLFYWTLFEGVPKFYNDAWQQDALNENEGYRRTTLSRLFLEGVSPLRDEADNWFLHELRGRYDSVLKAIASQQPCSHSELRNAFRMELGEEKQQLAGYLKILIERYRMITVRKPIFSADKQRNSRYEITDNFLAAWLRAIRRAADLARIQPVERAAGMADARLADLEGFSIEKMIRQLLRQASAKGLGPISLTRLVDGWWDKPDSEQASIEIDIVAVDEHNRRILFGSCKRSPARHNRDGLAKFSAHVDRFLETSIGRRYAHYDRIHYAFAPKFSMADRQLVKAAGFVPMDLSDFKLLLG